MNPSQDTLVDLDIVYVWENHAHAELTRSTRAEADHAKLAGLCTSSCIKVIDGEEISSYLPDAISSHRTSLDNALKFRDPKTYSASEYLEFEGTEYDVDLSTIDGVWRDPLPPFSNLIILDIDLPSAIYWLLPILSACRDNLFLRRIIIRDVDDLFHMPWDFPLRKLDLLLSSLPLVHVILVYPPDTFARYIAGRMPLTMHFKRLHSLQPTIDNADWMDYEFDPKQDPVGADSMFVKIKELSLELVLPDLRVKGKGVSRSLKRRHT